MVCGRDDRTRLDRIVQQRRMRQLHRSGVPRTHAKPHSGRRDADPDSVASRRDTDTDASRRNADTNGYAYVYANAHTNARSAAGGTFMRG